MQRRIQQHLTEQLERQRRSICTLSLLGTLLLALAALVHHVTSSGTWTPINWSPATLIGGPHLGNEKQRSQLTPCTQPELHVGGSVYVIPALLEPAAPCGPPLEPSVNSLTGETSQELPVGGA